MLLAVDVGNTHTVVGLYDGAQLCHDFRIETAVRRTADEYQLLMFGLLELAGIDRRQLTAGVLSSVVPPVNDALLDAIDRGFEIQMLVVGPGTRTGLKILYENPREVGADRIANAVAARERVDGSVVIVDFGTATTFDGMSSAGEYLGGVIAPGVQISADALHAHAAKLPRVELADPGTVLGRNTVHAMQSGLFYGYLALVDGVVERLKTELGDPVSVIATGGLAPVMAPHSETIDLTDEYLTLDGLRILHERNT